MGIYSTGTVFNENHLEDIDVQESAYTPGLSGALQNILDEETNYARLMEAVAIAELNHFEQHGTEMVYEGANLSGFFGKVREFFKNMFEKIKGLFKKFISFIDSLIMNDKAFVNKYRTTLAKVVTKDFEYKGFKFTPGAFNLEANLRAAEAKHGLTAAVKASDISAGDASKYDTAAKKWQTDRTDLIEEMRGAVAGDGSKKYDDAEFYKVIFEKLRDGKDKPDTITTVDAAAELNKISAFKEAKKISEKQFKVLEDEINKIIKDLNDTEKEISKAITGTTVDKDVDTARAAAIRFASAKAEAEKARLGLGQKAQGLVMSALKQEYRQAKAICVKLVGYKPKNESVNLGGAGIYESVVFQ